MVCHLLATITWSLGPCSCYTAGLRRDHTPTFIPELNFLVLARTEVQNHKIVESFILEKASKIIKSNHLLHPIEHSICLPFSSGL